MRKLTFVLYADFKKDREVIEGVTKVARRTGSPLIESASEELEEPLQKVRRARCLDEDISGAHVGWDPCGNCRYVDHDLVAVTHVEREPHRTTKIYSLRDFEREKAQHMSTEEFARDAEASGWGVDLSNPGRPRVFSIRP